MLLHVRLLDSFMFRNLVQWRMQCEGALYLQGDAGVRYGTGLCESGNDSPGGWYR